MSTTDTLRRRKGAGATTDTDANGQGRNENSQQEQQQDDEGIATALHTYSNGGNSTNTNNNATPTPTLRDMDRSMRRASSATLVIWLLLLVIAYASVPSWDCLQGPEKYSAMLAGLLLGSSLLYTRGLPMVLKAALPLEYNNNSVSSSSSHHHHHGSGILVGGMTTQLVAIATNLLMAFAPVPVLLDPVLTAVGYNASTDSYQWQPKRVSVLRWAEFAALAFLMTYLTEAFAVPDDSDTSSTDSTDSSDKKGKKKEHNNTINTFLTRYYHAIHSLITNHTSLSIPMAHAVCQGLATWTGMLFPYCGGAKSWYCLLLVACVLYSVIFPRWHHKQKLVAKMNPGTTLDEAVLYDRARLSLRMLTACTVCWTLFPIVFFGCGFVLPFLYTHATTTTTTTQSWLRFMSHPAIPMVLEAGLDVVSKLVQMNVIMDIHNGVFDDPDAVRALQRLLEVKDAIGPQAWRHANDIVVISVRQEFSGRVAFMVSPSAFVDTTVVVEDAAAAAAENDGDGNESAAETTVDLDNYDEAEEHDNENDTDEEEPTASHVFSLGWEHFGNQNDRKESEQQQLLSVIPSIVSGVGADARRLGALAGLVVRAWDTTNESQPRVSLEHRVDAVLCDAEITRVEEHLLVVVVKGLR